MLVAQNLVPNYSFDTLTDCPSDVGYQGPLYAPPWDGPTAGTPDIFNVCATNPIVGVPNNFGGTQEPLTGDGYGGIICHLPTYECREYMMAPLIEPLAGGQWYHVSFYVSLGENFNCGIEKLGAYFSQSAPYGWYVGVMNVTPQIESNQGFISDEIGWTLISGCFQAQGGEQFITLGTFHSDADTPLDPNCSGGRTYYYLENISVITTDISDDLPLELGDPVTACPPYVIDPDLSGYYYTWQDGSHGSTFEVTESGMYVLTISDGCNYGVDSIEVTIAGNYPPVDLGPDEAVICYGDTYFISLDPTLSTYVWQDGSTGPEFTITSPGLYSVTLDDGCLSTTDDIMISFFDPPSSFTLGPDDFICPGEVIEYFFDPDLGQFLWQDNSTSSDYTISEGGTYQLVISHMCGSLSDEIEITPLEPPVVEIGPDTMTICNGSVIHLEIEPQSGDILWQDGSTSTDYLIDEPGLYSVTVMNTCGIATDTMEVIVDFPPFVSLGPDTILCPGESITLYAETQNAFFNWQDNSTADSLVVSSAGTYSITATNDCGIAEDTVVIMATATLTPLAFGPDVNICPGEQIILYATNPNANYLWQDASTLDSFIVTNPGTYTLIEYNICSMTTDTMIVIINGDPPQIDLPSAFALCQGDTIILDAAINGVNYLWSDNSQNQQLIVHTPGTYSLTVSNACGTDVDTTIIIDGGPSPAVDLGTDIQLCPGDNILLSPVFSNVDAWQWQDGSTAATYTVSGTGLVHVVVNNSCGSAFDTIQVNILPATPPIDLGADTALCSGESFVLSINTPGITIEWPDGSSGANYNVSGSGLVYASITNSCGSSFDTILVSALPDVPALDLGIDQSLCPGEIISVSPGIANIQYLWQDGSTGNSYQSTQEETIILTISNDCGSSTDTIEVTESTQGPQLDLGQDVQVCAGETVTIQSGISGVNYAWQDGSTDPDFTTTQSGVFILAVNNNCGSATDTIVVDISGVPPTPVLPADTTLCEGITLTLTSTADAETTIEWQNGSSAPTFTVSTAGVYTLSESNRCGDAADTITVAYLDAPDPFTLGADTTLCPGETLMLNAPSTSYAIIWQDGSDETNLVANQAGTYSLQISNECGTESDEFVLDYDTRVPLLNLPPTISWCPGDIVTLDATQPFPAAYSWSTGATSSSIQIVTPGVYIIEVATTCSIVSMDVDVFPGTDCIEADAHNDIYIPNVFSPNGDGINDKFALSFGSDLQVTAMTGSIFDRWGNLVYSSDEIPFEWDGFFADEAMMSGVYAYLIRCTYLEGSVERERVFAGDVTLMK